MRVARRAIHGALIETVAAVVVVGRARSIGGLVDDGRTAGVIAHVEKDIARAAIVVARQAREINTGDGGGRHGPGRRFEPVAAVDQTGGIAGVDPAGRLCAWSDVGDGGDLACAVTRVP